MLRLITVALDASFGDRRVTCLYGQSKSSLQKPRAKKKHRILLVSIARVCFGVIDNLPNRRVSVQSGLNRLSKTADGVIEACETLEEMNSFL